MSKGAGMSRRLIPKLTPPLLRAALSKVLSELRSEVIKIFQEYPYVGLTIDGVTINSRHFSNVDFLHCHELRCLLSIFCPEAVTRQENLWSDSQVY
jgi:hypothetical protein